MSFLRKPSNLYNKELPKVGRQANPNLSYDDELPKLNFFQILLKGLLKEELDPKHYKRYENFVYNFKVYTLTFLIGYGLFYMVFNSAVMTGPYTGDQEPGWFDKGLDYVLNFLGDRWDDVKRLF